MARAWMDTEDGEIETPLGVMRYAITQGNHVFLSAGGSSDKLQPLVINRVPYYVNSHLYLQPDGTWARKDWHDPYLSRIGSLEQASQAAKDKAYAHIQQAWGDFIAENPGLLIEAERRHLNNEIGRAEEEMEKAQAEMEKLADHRNDLLRREADLGG